MLTFVCVYFKPEESVAPCSYNAAWVNRLYHGVARNLPRMDWRFVCLTNTGDGEAFDTRIQLVDLVLRPTGWFSIMEIFRPDIATERTLFCGLDTVICGDLTEIANTETCFGTITDPYYPPKICDGFLSYMPECADFLWQQYTWQRSKWHKECLLGKRPSEMVFLRDHVKEPLLFDKVLPGQIMSYKVHVRENQAPTRNCRVLYFHGDPRPDQVDHPLVTDHWI